MLIIIASLNNKLMINLIYNTTASIYDYVSSPMVIAQFMWNKKIYLKFTY